MKKIILIGLCISLLLINGCKQECKEYKEIMGCTYMVKFFRIPENYEGNLDNFPVEIHGEQDVHIITVIEENITEPFIDPKNTSQYYCPVDKWEKVKKCVHYG